MIVGVLALQGAFLEHVTMLNKVKLERGFDIEVITVRNKEELDVCSALLIPGGESTVILSCATSSPGLLPALTAFISDPTRPVYGSCAGMILMADEDGVGGGPRRGMRQRGLGGIKGMRVWRNLYGNQLASFEAPLHIPVLSDPSRPFPGIFIRAPAIHSFLPGTNVTTDESEGGDRVDGADESIQYPAQGDGEAVNGGLASPTTPKASKALPVHLPDPSQPSHTPQDQTEPLCLLPPSLSASPPKPSTSTSSSTSTPDPSSDFGPADSFALRIVMARQGRHLVTSFHPELSQDERIHEYFLLEMCGLGS